MLCGGDGTTALNKQERAYSVLRERVLSGAYSPGYRLVIDALADELEMSALPIREAIRRLEAEGLVVYRPNAGAHVAPAEPALFEEMMTGLAVLEGFATALAAPEIDGEDVRRLKTINQRMAQCMDRLDALGFGRANREFHLLIYERCPNAYVVELLKDTERRLDAIRRTVFTHIPYRGHTSIEEHDRIIELIESASADRIEAAARRHKLETVKAFREWREEHDALEPAVGVPATESPAVKPTRPLSYAPSASPARPSRRRPEARSRPR
jgi:DNA-binding GntR family transcriptional regulator